ncbi:hypothetical protein HK096_004625 [Nowakowskiella sp. JEL0078]|nr:hypothetical protein HK096_004625 [Nowakowskiella sp. JEL0078]
MGRFYKPVPYGTKATNVILPLMGKLFDGIPTTENGRTLEEIINLDRERVQLEYTARLLFLRVLFEIDKNLTPEQFLREQLNGGIETITNLVSKLREYHTINIRDILVAVQTQLRAFRGVRGLVVALDEAQIAGKN